jgi:hypothetical protein
MGLFSSIVKVSGKVAVDAGESVVQKSVTTGIKTGIKSSDNVALNVAKNITARSGSTITQKIETTALKTGGVIAKENQVGTSAALSELSAGAKKIAKQTETEAAAASKSFLAKNPKLVIGGVTAAGVAAYSGAKFAERNNKVVGITKIESNASGVLLTYTPALKILSTDNVDLTNTNCVPSINGTGLEVLKVLSQTQIVVAGKITSAGTSGSIKNHTSFEGQATDAIATAAGSAVQAGATVAASAVTGGLTGAGVDPGAFFAQLSAYKPYVIGILVLLLLLKIAPMFMGHRTGYTEQPKPITPVTASAAAATILTLATIL